MKMKRIVTESNVSFPKMCLKCIVFLTKSVMLIWTVFTVLFFFTISKKAVAKSLRNSKWNPGQTDQQQYNVGKRKEE